MPSTEATATVLEVLAIVVDFLPDNRKKYKKQHVDTFIVELRKCFYIVLVLAVKNHKIIFNDPSFLSFHFMILFRVLSHCQGCLLHLKPPPYLPCHLGANLVSRGSHS